MRAVAVSPPETSDSTSFGTVIGATLCPFARKAAIRDLPAVGPDEQIDAYLRRIAPLAREWVRDAETNETDGILAVLPACRVGTDPDDLAPMVAAWVDAVADHLATRDPYVGDVGWRLVVAGVDVFVALFTPAFGPDHSRSTPRGEHVYLLIQPDSSFHRWLPEDSVRLREKIRQQFADAGRAYDADLREAERYLPPADGRSPVPWWLHGAEGTAL